MAAVHGATAKVFEVRRNPTEEGGVTKTEEDNIVVEISDNFVRRFAQEFWNSMRAPEAMLDYVRTCMKKAAKPGPLIDISDGMVAEGMRIYDAHTFWNSTPKSKEAFLKELYHAMQRQKLKEDQSRPSQSGITGGYEGLVVGVGPRESTGSRTYDSLGAEFPFSAGEKQQWINQAADAKRG